MGETNLKTVNQKLDSIQADVIALEGVVSQYSKSGMLIAEIGMTGYWALEMNTDFAPPTTTEIEPGNYKIDQLRGGTTTPIVALTPASESVGTIYASLLLSEATWNIGDVVKVTFQDGYIRTDEEPTEAPTADVTAGTNYVDVLDTDLYQVGWLCRVYDTVNGSEWNTITSIPSGTRLVFQNVWVSNHLIAAPDSCMITRAIRYDLTTAIFFTMIQEEAASFRILYQGTFTNGASATAPADTVAGGLFGNDFFKGSWLMPIAGGMHNQPRLIVGFATTTGIYTIDAEQPFTAAPSAVEYVVLGNNSQLVPAVDGHNIQTPAQTIGNKGDSVNIAATASLVALLRDLIAGLSIVDAGAGGGFEIDGSPSLKDGLGTTGAIVTDSATSVLGATGANNANNAFLSDLVTADDDGSVLERLEWLQSMAVIAKGDYTNASATVPADNTGRPEASGYFDGSWLMTITPADATYLQPRLIVNFNNTGGVFTLDPEHYFVGTPTLGSEYVVLSPNDSLVPGANVLSNYTPAHVIGNKTDAATNDNMSALATASLVAEMKRALIRMSPDAFTATIQGGAETALDAMLGALATYFSASGAAMSIQVNNLTARTNLEQALEDYFGVVGCDGTNVFNPDIQGSARTTLDVALAALATYIAASGAAYSVQMNNQTARTNIEQTFEDLTTVFGVDGTNVLTNINNSANTTYNAISQKFAAIIGADGANVFNPSIGGTARTTFDDAFAALGTAFGAEYDGSPDLYDTIVTGYDSSAIVGNPDGSVMERLENIHDDISNFSGGLGYRGVCTSDGTPTTAIVLGLGGYGNDVFSGKYYIQIIYNASGAGTSPEPKVRKITDYDSVTGTFTFATVTDAPLIGDIVLVFHESLAAIGHDEANSDFSSSNVTADADGTVLERLEWLQSLDIPTYGDTLYYSVGGTGGTAFPIGTQTAPCNSLANLITIAAANGVNKIIALTNWTLDFVTVPVLPSGLTIKGLTEETTITLGGCDVSGVTFENCKITGVQGGTATFFIAKNCTIDAVTALNASLYDCVFAGTSTFYAGADNTWVGITADDAIIDGTGLNANNLVIYELRGLLTLESVIDATAAMNFYCDDAVVVGDVTSSAGTVAIWGEANVTNAGTITFVDKTLNAEVETTSLIAGGGSVADNAREGALVRYIADNLVASNTYGEKIPDTYFTKAAITTAVTPPPASEAACTIVSIPAVANTEFVLRGLWINTTSFGTGTQITYELWVSVSGTPISVDSVIVNGLGWQNLMDLFGLQEVNSASIYVTAITDVGNTGAASGTYHYASAT